MSFDLLVWDADRPPGIADAQSRYEEARGRGRPAGDPGERLKALVDECDRRWPVGADADERPFCGRCSRSTFLATIRQDAATALFGEWVDMAERHGLILYDPQSGIIKIPSRLSFDSNPPPGPGVRPPLRQLLKRRRV